MTNKDFPTDFNGREETVVGVHQGTGVELVEGMNTSLSRYYCTNCRRKIHCFVKVDKKTGEATFKNNCKDKECECRCTTHYVCKLCGHLHPYDQKVCNAPTEEERKPTPELDALIEKLNKQVAEERERNKIEVKSK